MRPLLLQIPECFDLLGKQPLIIGLHDVEAIDGVEVPRCRAVTTHTNFIEAERVIPHTVEAFATTILLEWTESRHCWRRIWLGAVTVGWKCGHARKPRDTWICRNRHRPRVVVQNWPGLMSSKHMNEAIAPIPIRREADMCALSCWFHDNRFLEKTALSR